MPDDHLGRTDKDFAIEFGEYLATSAVRLLACLNNEDRAATYEARQALESAIYEFRKRAAKARNDD